jgi:hypothetical protein
MIKRFSVSKRGSLSRLFIISIIFLIIFSIYVSANEVTEPDFSIVPAPVEEVVTEEPVETPILEPEPEEPGSQTPENIELVVEINYPDKITRGSSFELKTIVENKGNIDAKQVRVVWNLPEEVEIEGGSEVEECGDLRPGGICESTLMCKSTQLVKLGKNEIKSIITYEEK